MRIAHDLVDSMLWHIQGQFPLLSRHQLPLVHAVQTENTQPRGSTSRSCCRETTRGPEYSIRLQQDILYVRQPHCPIPLIVLLRPCWLHSEQKNLASSTLSVLFSPGKVYVPFSHEFSRRRQRPEAD